MTTCQQKFQFPSRKAAERGIKSRLRKNPTLYLRAYLCNVCGLWHMTSQPDRKECAA